MRRHWPVLLVLVAGCLLLATTGAGPAVATAGNLSATPDPVNSTTEVTVAADADTAGADLTFAIDGDGNGTITAAEAIGTVTSNASTGDGNRSTALGSLVAGEGTYTVYVVEEADGDGTDDTAYPVTDPDAVYDRSVTVEVDDTAPTASAFAVTNPTGREVRITFNTSEPIGAATVDVAGPDPATLAAVDLVGSGDGPYAYETTYHPAADGEYTVTLESVADLAANPTTVGRTTTTVAAVAARNEHTLFANTSPVYLGEPTVDVSPVLGDGPVTLTGVSGAARGTVAAGNASALAVTESAGFAPGGYDATGDGEADIRVEDPAVTDLSLILERGTSDVDAAGGFLQLGDAVTLSAAFGFGAADDLEVAVIDPDGLDVAPTLGADTTLASADETVRLDTAGFAGDPGVYTIRVSADPLEAAASTTITIVDRDPSLSLSRTRVVRGRSVIATAYGPPGGTAVVRIPTGALGNASTPAETVFERTGDVTTITRGSGHVAAEVALGVDGIARTRFGTGALAPGAASIALRLGNGSGLGEPADDQVPLSVDPRRVTLHDPPGTATVNEPVTLVGEAPQSDSVAAYVRLGDRWHPTAGTAPVSVNVTADGAFELELPVTGELAIPGTYQLAVVGRSEAAAVDTDGDGLLTSTELSAVPYETVTIEIQGA